MFDCVHCCCEVGGWLSKLWIKQRQQQQQFSTTTSKQLDMQVLFSSFFSNSPGNLGFIYTLWKKGGNIVCFGLLQGLLSVYTFS